MSSVDQSGFDNQLSGEWIDAAAATALLGVKRATLYAYVSRGLVRSMPGPDPRSRGRRYHRGDLGRLAARAGARRGHAPVAAAALQWGDPVLDTEITEITSAGPRYRGQLAVDRIRAGDRFESIAELLWTGDAGPWPVCRAMAPVRAARAGAIAAMSVLVPLLAAGDRDRHGAGAAAERARGRALIAALAGCAADHIGRGRAPRSDGPIAERLLRGRRRRPTSAEIEAVEAALIAVADHGVAVSTFAARVAASAGADLYACVAAALAAVSGPAHGGACDRIEALAAACSSPRGAAAHIRRRIDVGDAVVGFGHPLYPGGDPRSPPLRRRARALGADPTLAAIARAARRAGRPEPAVDFALVELAAALGLPSGSAAALFAVGRAAGWIAHTLEQRAAGYLVRPRARYMARATAAAER